METKSYNFWRLFFAVLCLFSYLISEAQTANFTTSPSSSGGCGSFNVAFTSTSTGASSYLWNFGNGNTSSLSGPSAIFSPAGTYNVTLTINPPSAFTHTEIITVFAGPTANFTTSAMPSCVGKPVTFTDNTIAGSGALTSWEWDFGDGGIQTTASGSASHTYSTTGSFPVSMKVYDAKGCSQSILKTVTIVSSPIASFTGSPQSSCTAPLTVTFTNNSTASGIADYLWRFGDGATSTLPAPSHLYGSMGTYTVTLIVTQGSCKDSMVNTGFVSIANSTSANFYAVSTSLCLGQSAQFYDISSPLTATQLWNFGDGTTSTDTHPLHTYSAIGNYTVTLTEGPPGCQNTNTQTSYITVSTAPVATFTASKTYGCDIPLNLTFSNTTTAGASYYWDFGDGTSSTIANPPHTYNNPGIFSVSLTVSKGGCAITNTKNNYITVVDPHVNFGGTPRKGCIPLPVTFTDSSYSYYDPIVSYTWNFGNGSATTTSTFINNTYNTINSFNVKLVVTTSLGCKDSVTKYAFIKTGAKPNANFSIIAPIVCHGKNAVFTDLSTGADSAFWQFDVNQGVFSTPSGVALPYSPVTNSFPDTGTFFVAQTVFKNGCPDTLKIDNMVTILPPKPMFTYQLSCSSIYSVSCTDFSIAADSITWNFGDGSPLLSNDSTPTHIYATRGVKTITLTAYNFLTGCSDSIPYSFIISEPLAQFTVDTLFGCSPMYLNFYNTSQDANSNIWNFGDGVYNYDIPISPAPIGYSYYQNGLYTVKLVVTDIYGCQDTATKVITVSGPTANFNSNFTTGCTPFPITLTDASVSDSAIVQWTWNFGDGPSQTTTDTVINHIYTTPGYYNVSLTVLDTNGCTQSTTKYSYIQPTYPYPAFVSDTFACRNELVFFNASSSVVAYPATFKWTFGDGSIDSTTGVYPTHAYVSDSLYTVTLKITDANGCDSTIQHQVRIQHPQALFTDSVPLIQCGNTQMHYLDISPGLAINAWQWNFGDGAISFLQNANHNYTVPGSYNVSLNVTNGAGCQNTITDSVYVPGPSGSFTFTPQNGCKPLTVTFTAVSQSASSYTWDFGDGTVITSGDSVVQYTYMDTIFNKIPQLILNSILPDGSPCTLSATTVGTLNVTYPYPTFVNDTFACRNQVVTFDASGTKVAPPATYSWDFGDASPSQTVAVPTISHTYTSDSLFTVTLTVTDVNGCDSTIQNNIRIQQPVAGFSDAVFLERCDSTEMEFTDNSNGLSLTGWLWDFGDGKTSTLQNPHHNYTTAGTYIVTLIVTNSAGCTHTLSKSVIVPGPLPGTFSFTPHTGCLPLTVTFTEISNATSYFWDFGNGTLDTTSSVVQHIYTDTITVTPLVYLIFVLPDGTTCTLPPDSAGVLSIKTILPAFATDTFACRNQSLLFDASATIVVPPATYAWNFGDGTTGSGMVINHPYNSDNLYNVTLTVTDANGCDSTILYQILVQQPVAAFSDAVFLETCDSTVMAFTDSSTGVSIIDWWWNFGDGFTDTLQNPHHNYAIAGTYTVKLVVTNSAGCTDTLSKSVIVPGPIPGTFSFTPHIGCLPLAVSFTAISNATSYTWDFGDGISFTTNDSIVQHTYTDTATLTPLLYLNFLLPDGTTCILPPDSAGEVIVKTIYPAFVTDTFACINQTVTFDASATIAGFPANYLWDFGDNTDSLSANAFITHSYNSNNLYTVTLTVTDVYGCDSSIHIQHQLRIQNPQAAFSASVFLERCDSTEMLFTDNSAGLSIVDWQWNFGDGTTDTLQNPHHNYTIAGSYSVSLIVTNFAGCSDTVTNSIFVPGPSTGTFSFTPHTGCLPLAVTFTAVSSSTIPTSYTWDLGDTVIYNSPDSVIQYTYLDTLTATPQLYLNFLLPDGTTCTLPPDSAGVIAVKTIYPTFVTDTFACRNQVVTFDASGTIASPPANYAWDFDDGTILIGTGSTVTHAYTSDNLYNVTLTVTDANGCDSSIHVQHQLQVQNPNAFFTDFVFLEGCDSTEMEFNNYSTGLNITNWQWNFGDGEGASVQNPHHNYTISGTYTVTLFVTNFRGCTDTLTKSVIVPGPTGTFSFTPDTGCPPLTVTFTAVSNANTFIWDFGNGIPLDTTTSPVVQYTYQDTISTTPHLNIMLSNGTGCALTSTSVPSIITVHPRVTALFSVNSTDLNLPYEVLICTNQSVWADSYNWSFGDGSTSTSVNPEYLYSTVGIYQIQLIAMSQFGCRDTAYSEITTNAEVVFPNAFTPNSNGTTNGFYDITNNFDNDIFYPFTSGVINYDLIIYNRWGEVVFETKDIKQGWDGYYKGKLCEQGVYIWKAYLKLNNGKEFDKNGNLTLMR